MPYLDVELNGKTYQIDAFLKKKLDNCIKIMEKDFDVVFLIDGIEGSGKSRLALFCGYYISNGKITSYNVCSGGTDAIEKLERLPDKSVLIIDEGSLIFSSKEAMKREQVKLIKILNVIRQKRMCLIIVSPSFFNLNKYISVERSRFLLHVYTGRNLERGRYCYFGEKKKKMLYIVGKKNYNSYKKPRSNFVGNFQDFEPPFIMEYEDTKKKSLMEALHEKTTADGIRISRKKFYIGRLIEHLQKELGINQSQVAEILGVHQTNVGELLKEYREVLEIPEIARKMPITVKN
jgi:predicted XRE-type DNA-binding protein